jgi:hypothetical protein
VRHESGREFDQRGHDLSVHGDRVVEKIGRAVQVRKLRRRGSQQLQAREHRVEKRNHRMALGVPNKDPRAAQHNLKRVHRRRTLWLKEFH